MAIILSTALANALAGKDVPQTYAPPSAGAALTDGCSFKKAMQLGFLDIFGGTRPASPDLTEGSTRLIRISKDAGATGLSFEATGDIAAGKVQKLSTETWSGLVTLAGTATWFRFYCCLAGDTGGASTNWMRFDGSVGTTTSADLLLANPALVLGAPLIIGTFDVQLPIT